MTTVAVTDYASLGAAINDTTEGGYDTGELDRIIGLAEADFRLYFGPNYARQSSATVSFVSGSVALPSGFLRPLALSHSTYGLMDEADIGTIREARIGGSGTPSRYTITATTIEVDASFTGDMTFDYEGTLAGLTNANTTNWLILNAPQAYLQMCVHYAKGLDEDPSAPAYKAAALQTLNDLGIQSTVAQMARSTVRIPGATP